MRTNTLLVIALMLSTVLGCARLLPAPNPMRVVNYLGPSPQAKCLLVLLPGAGDSAEDFDRNGFIADLRARDLSLDVVAANATVGYYFGGTVVDRLSADVFVPAFAHGYPHIWALGVSMGGFGTLLYSLQRPGQIAGVMAIAPYLGDEKVIREVRAAGVDKWVAPPSEGVTEDNYQRQLWRWLQALSRGSEKGPDLYLAYGADDRRTGESAGLLATALKPDHVWTTPGGHDWPYWRQLLAKFLADSDFVRECAK